MRQEARKCVEEGRGTRDLKRSIKLLLIAAVLIRFSHFMSNSGSNTCHYGKSCDAERLLFCFALLDREEDTKKDATSQQEHVCKLSSS